MEHQKAVLSVDIALKNNTIKIVSGDADGKVLFWTIEVVGDKRNKEARAKIKELTQ